MSTLGIKGKVQETISKLNAVRKDKEKPRDITLRQYVGEQFKEEGKGISLGKFLHEIGVDMNRTTVDELMGHDDNAHLMSEIVREGARQGLGVAAMGPVVTGQPGSFLNPDVNLPVVDRSIVQRSFFQDLIVREETVPQKNVTVPYVNTSDAEMEVTGEGETIGVGTVVYDEKTVALSKRTRGLRVTYESIRYNTLSLAQVWFRHAGLKLGNKLNNMAVDVIVDGDVAGGAEAAAVIGVEDTNDGVTWFDIARAAIQGGLIGHNYLQAIGDATTVLEYVNLEEMKKMFYGNPLLQTTLRSPLIMPSSLYPSARAAADQLILNDPAGSLVQLTSAPLMVESGKIISKQMEEAYISITTGFAKLQRTASVVIDGSVAYSGAQFPAWMQPEDDDE